jgi:hypothetical protein
MNAKTESTGGSFQKTVPYHMVCMAQKQAFRDTGEVQDTGRVNQEYCKKITMD